MKITTKQASKACFKRHATAVLSCTLARAIHKENIICRKRKLEDVAHEQTIICRQLIAGHVIGSRLMRRKLNLDQMITNIMLHSAVRVGV